MGRRRQSRKGNAPKGNQRRCRLACQVLVAVLPAVAASSAAAQAPAAAALAADVKDVALVTPAVDDQVLLQAMARIRLELGAAQLQTHLVDCGDADALDTEACLAARARSVATAPEPTGAAGGPESPGPVADAPLVEGTPPAPTTAATTAVLSLSRRGRAVVVDAVASLPSGTKIFRLAHLPAGPTAGDPAMLALRAVELLRDVRLEAIRSAREEERENEAQRRRLPTRIAQAPSAAPPVVVPAAVPVVPAAVSAAPLVVTAQASDGPPAPTDPLPRWDIGAGAMALQGSRGFGTAWAPALQVAATFKYGLGAEVVLAGPFFSHHPAAGYGALEARQELAAAGARWTFQRGPVRPFASVLVGAHHLRMLAVPDPTLTPNPPYRQGAWSMLASGTAGAFVPIWGRFALTAEAGALATLPPTELGVGFTVLGRVGGPSLIYRLSVVAQLP